MFEDNTLVAELMALRLENKQLKAGLEAVNELINNSYGVEGLHLNGDTAIWEELLKGGRFEAWLLDFSDALELVNT